MEFTMPLCIPEASILTEVVFINSIYELPCLHQHFANNVSILPAQSQRHRDESHFPKTKFSFFQQPREDHQQNTLVVLDESLLALTAMVTIYL